MPQSYYAKENIGENSQTEENLQKKTTFLRFYSPHLLTITPDHLPRTRFIIIYNNITTTTTNNKKTGDLSIAGQQKHQ